MRKDEYNWLDDPFDEEKQAQEMQRAQSSRNIGCLVGALAVIIIVVVICVFGCMAVGAFVF